MSSPSSARSAITLPTEIFLLPSGACELVERLVRHVVYDAHQNLAHNTILLGFDVYCCLVCFLSTWLVLSKVY